MATSTIRNKLFEALHNLLYGVSYTSAATNTWERVGSFTLPKPALVYVLSSYNARTVGLGIQNTSATIPDGGYVEGSNHIYRTPVFYLNAGTYYLAVKTNSTSAANTYSVIGIY